MKHLFTSLALACVCAAQAWAVDVTPVTPERYDVSPVLTATRALHTEAPKAEFKAPALKAMSMADVCGDYYTSCDNMLEGNVDSYDLTLRVSDEATRQIAIQGLPLDRPIYGTLNEDGTVLTVPNRQFLRMVGNDSIFFYFKQFNKDGVTPADGISPVASVQGYVTTKSIVFDMDPIWTIGDPKNEKPGYFFMAYSMVFMKYIDNWSPIGKATFQDGWVLPGFGIDQTDRANWYEVEMEQDKTRPTRYRLVNPYHGDCPVVDQNQDTRGGYIQFDIKDPDHVTFDFVPAGFTYTGAGISGMYCYNYLSALTLELGDPAAVIVKTLGDGIPYTTYKDGVLSLNSLFSLQFGTHIQDACFGVQNNIGAGMGWTDAAGKHANMTTRIFFPGAELPSPDEGWKYYGTATFQDGWILPVYGIDQTNPENWYEVTVQVKENDPNVFRLVDPYHTEGCPVTKYNQSTKAGYIQFNVSDPDHVTFDIVSCGMAEPALKMTTMYLYNTLTSYMQNMGLTAEEIIDAIGPSIPYSTFKDGVLNMTGYIENPSGEIEYDCCLGSQLNIKASQRWKVLGGEMANMSTIITLKRDTGIETVGYDANADAPVEYFNLQGMRVAQPAAGQIVIRRQGTDVTKLLVK